MENHITFRMVLLFISENKKAPSKDNKHRAMDDIKESIKELKYYKANIFKESKSGRQSQSTL